jgi:hypothetical protein
MVGALKSRLGLGLSHAESKLCSYYRVPEVTLAGTFGLDFLQRQEEKTGGDGRMRIRI